MKVLAVDDDKLNLQIVERYLKIYFPDFEVQLCHDPKLVEGLLETEDIDILLLDIMMPDISGIDILKETRSKIKYWDMQIIMLTAMTDDESFRTCFELGSNDFIRKPLNITEFRARIKAATNTRKNNIILQRMYESVIERNNKLKSVNVQLKETQFHLIQAGKMAAIGELAAGLAHEINNPIGYVESNLETMSGYILKIKQFISSHIELLNLLSKNDETSIKRHECEVNMDNYKKHNMEFILNDMNDIITDSQEGIKKVEEIVKSLMSFAENGTEEDKEYCSINEVINQVLLFTKQEAKTKAQINLELMELPDIYCNKAQIGQVFLNILINAIQAVKSQKRSEPGNIWIKTYAEHGFVCISVCDDGPGINKDEFSNVFDPFYTTKDVGEGTGIGLSISHDIVVKKHKGVLDIKSEPNCGAEFIIRLPQKSHED